MLSDLLPYALGGLVLCFTIGMLIHYLRTDNDDKGEAEESNRQMKELLDEARIVKEARDALRRDPNNAAAKLLRDRYTRR